MKHAALLILLSLPMAGCGAFANEGEFTVGAGAKVLLEVRGPGRVTIELDNHSMVELERWSIAADGTETLEGAFPAGAAYRLASEGDKRILFVNRGTGTATVHYRATSSTSGRVEVSMRPHE